MLLSIKIVCHCAALLACVCLTHAAVSKRSGSERCVDGIDHSSLSVLQRPVRGWFYCLGSDHSNFDSPGYSTYPALPLGSFNTGIQFPGWVRCTTDGQQQPYTRKCGQGRLLARLAQGLPSVRHPTGLSRTNTVIFRHTNPAHGQHPLGPSNQANERPIGHVFQKESNAIPANITHKESKFPTNRKKYCLYCGLVICPFTQGHRKMPPCWHTLCALALPAVKCSLCAMAQWYTQLTSSSSCRCITSATCQLAGPGTYFVPESGLRGR